MYENEADAAEGREFMIAIGRGASAGSTSGGAVASGGAMATQANGSATGFGTGASMTSGAGTAPSIAGGGTNASFIEIAADRPDFQKNIVEVSSKNPELLKLLREHAEAARKYEALYRKVNADAPAAGAAAPAK